MNPQALAEAKAMVADLSTAETLADLDNLYVNWIGYSALTDDPNQTADQLRADLWDYIEAFCTSTSEPPEAGPLALAVLRLLAVATWDEDTDRAEFDAAVQHAEQALSTGAAS